MTTAFIAEIHNADGSVYFVGKGSSTISSWPHFFRGKQSLLTRIERLLRWNYLKAGGVLKVIRVSNLEAGLKDSVAEVFTYDEFKELPTKVQLSKPGAVYKLQYADGRFAGPGVNGKTWAHGGHVRAAITGYPRGIKSFEGGTVHEITYDDDGIWPKEVRRIPAEKFYAMSPSSAKRIRR